MLFDLLVRECAGMVQRWTELNEEFSLRLKADDALARAREMNLKKVPEANVENFKALTEG